MSSKIWLSSPHPSSYEKEFIQEAFERGELSTFGTNLAGFESDLEHYLSSRNVLALSSGTAAIHLAMILAGVQKNDEVLCQSMTFVASANPIHYVGAKPVFIDSEKDTWNMSPECLEEAIKHRLNQNKKPKAILYVHLYGMPAKYDEIKSIAETYEIPLIEDAAEALGSVYKGRKCGTLGNYSILSFNGNKMITTSGGGALLVDSQNEKEKALFYATQAKDQAPHYQHSEIGFNYRMSNINAGIGRGQMKVLEDRISSRKQNNDFYTQLFKAHTEIEVHREKADDIQSNHRLSALLINEEITDLKVSDISTILLEDNIESRPLWKPMHLQPLYEDCLFFGNGTSEDLFSRGICVPSGSNLTKEEKLRIRDSFHKILKR